MSGGYTELQVTTNYSFLEGGSHPAELILAAAALGMTTIAVTDRNSLAGIVRAHHAAKQAGVRLVVGSRLDLTDGASLLCLPTDRAAYGRLCQLLTLGRRRADKGDCLIGRADVAAASQGQILILLPPERPGRRFATELADWQSHSPGAVFLAAHYRYSQNDARRLALLAELAAKAGVPMVATNDVLYHSPDRRPLQDVLTAIRLGVPVANVGRRLAAHAERHLKRPAEMARLFAAYPDAIRQTGMIAQRCPFSLDTLQHEYPTEAPDPQATLVALAWQGAAQRFPAGLPADLQKTLRHELALIEQLGYAPYFLTVHDLVSFARSRNILCQGRGSAANSVVCYCLGITAVDPTIVELLFERFISVARNEPPDIDVDFEHERREEVIQYIYAKYGREHAGLAATVSHYRSRSALRDVGRAMGLSDDAIAALGKSRWGRHPEAINDRHIREIGFDPAEPTLAKALDLAGQLTGFPRHLSQHVGGFVITRGRLDQLVPVENARMEDRTVIQWDKDDLDAIGLLKIDVLALGMLTCIRKAFDLLRLQGHIVELATVPQEDKAVYDMLCRADTIGVFQIESRAQMSMLPRLRPRTFYDLVIQVAIVRPGPIQGGMVHPYLRRRQKKEKIDYPSPELKAVLEKTLGVPLFQEQAMKVAMVAAGFTADEADQLRRAMASFRNLGTVSTFRDKLIDGMVARHYPRDFAERIFKQIEGFGDYGFPESHAASFALLVYVSAWLKCHHPAVFACALLNSQPMGFYAPAQIVGDARAHGITVLPVDINHSAWDCTLEEGSLRLGLRQINGFAKQDADALLAARGSGYATPLLLWRRSGLSAPALTRLADADTFSSLGLARREALWAVRACNAPPLPLFAALRSSKETAVTLPAMHLGEQVVEDYSHLHLSLKAHPLSLLRPILDSNGILSAASLRDRKGRVAVAGLVLVRQRPGTASGVIFLTLEDETGVSNIVLWSHVFEKNRLAVLSGRMLQVTGKLQNEDNVIHVVAEQVMDRSAWLDSLAAPGIRVASRDFH